MKILRIIGFSFFFCFHSFSKKKQFFLEKKVNMPFLGQKGGDLLMFVYLVFPPEIMCQRGTTIGLLGQLL